MIHSHTPVQENRSASHKRQLLKRLQQVLIVVLTLLFISPLYYVIVSSLKTSLEIAENPFGLPSSPQWQNFSQVMGQLNYGRSIFNTMLITAGTCLVCIVLGALAAYPLSRVKARWAGGVYQIFLWGMTVPFFAIMSPLFVMVKNLGLVNTYWGLILVMVVLNLPTAVFFYSNFLRALPRELEEAAAIDGCSPAQAFRYVVLPLLKPITSTLLLFTGMSSWNSMLVPLLFLYDESKRPIMVSVFQTLGTYTLTPTTLFPAVILGSLPLLIIFLILQRQIVQGVAAGAVKG
ncbi:carbohydrate ABC transporter permease [Deinococcus misasensis]|uniref:carbohydrate ABC transporter permease n=1 Tax=Deinococcus misasensis TaxID=392413 RepID=UPI000551403B|nr:carbohydrate ABC transporter permease [Deinococcus misasensis]